MQQNYDKTHFVTIFLTGWVTVFGVLVYWFQLWCFSRHLSPFSFIWELFKSLLWASSIFFMLSDTNFNANNFWISFVTQFCYSLIGYLAALCWSLKRGWGGGGGVWVYLDKNMLTTPIKRNDLQSVCFWARLAAIELNIGMRSIKWEILTPNNLILISDLGRYQ